MGWRVRSLDALGRRYSAALGAVVLGLLLILALAVWIRQAGAERRALVEMEPVARRALYEHTLVTTEALCTPTPDDAALRQRCENFAEFLVAFPECDAECASVVRGLRRNVPTK